MRPVAVSVSAAIVGVISVVVVGALPACGVAPIRNDPGPPTTTIYVGPHGRPRAWGGGVCPLRTRHAHAYPPVPAAAFVVDGDGWRDTRRIVAFEGPHALAHGQCARTGRHEHALP
jgi:hypothetical protein